MTSDLDFNLLSLNYFFHRKVRVWQFKNGFRFALDAPLLAYFLEKSDYPALEVGTGCGIISLLVTYKKLFRQIIALEIQPELAALAEFNVAENNFQQSVSVYNSDFLKWKSSERFMTIFANPPYYPLRSGKPSNNQQKMLARFEVTINLKDLLKKCLQHLDHCGALYLILMASRENELRSLVAQSKIFIEKSLPVKPFVSSPPRRVLFKICCQKRDEEQLEPLIIFNEQKKYTPLLQKILSGDY